MNEDESLIGCPEIEVLKTVVVDIKSEAKKRDVTIEAIKESQNILAKETVAIIDVMAKKADSNQIKTMLAIEKLQNKKVHWFWKVLRVLVWLLFGVTYFIGSYLAIVKNLPK